MPWNGTGTYTRTNGVYTGTTVWGQDAAAGTLITDAHHDFHDQDIATALNNTVTRDGQGVATILSVVATVNSTTGVINIGSVNFASMPATGCVYIGGAGNFTGLSSYNIAIGSSALLVAGASTNTSVAIGRSSLTANSGGSDNVAVGDQTQAANVAGAQNVAIGSRAMSSAGATGTPTANIAIGFNAAPSLTTGSANIVIGGGKDVQSGTASNQLNIGGGFWGTGVGTATPKFGFGQSKTAPAYTIDAAGDIAANLAGNGFRVAEGSNAKMGVSTLAGGTIVVANTSVTANSRIFLTCETPGGTPGFLRVSARTAGTSFTILSSSGTDTSVVGWVIFEPA